ncbi:MAG TPA: hypothetical protein VF652_09280 [Allosphingosinicella sp.]|jgi:hypothetical protein
MSYNPWPPLERRTRLGILTLGAASWLAAVPAGLAGLMVFGFHKSVDEMRWYELTALLTLPLLPLLLALLGLACFLCFTRRGLLIVRALLAAVIVDALLLAAAFHWMYRPEPSIDRSWRPPGGSAAYGRAKAAPALVGTVAALNAAGCPCSRAG